MVVAIPKTRKRGLLIHDKKQAIMYTQCFINRGIKSTHFIYLSLFSLMLLVSCVKGEKVDFIVYNAQIHTMDQNKTIHEAMAIHDGKIVAIGPEREILNRFRSTGEINARKKDILPGIHDAHGHILGLAYKRLQVDVSKARSYYEMLLLLEKHHAKYPSAVIVGWGWDENKWGDSTLPNNSLLNERFPEIPVVLSRIDAHSYLVNSAAIDLVNGNLPDTISGGEIIKDSLGNPTGIFVDYAMDVINQQLPPTNLEALKQEVLRIQYELLSYGITTVHEAGVSSSERAIFETLNENDQLKLDIYLMLFFDDSNRRFALENGYYEHKNLTIRSFKTLLDGALGSEGACLIDPYHSQANHYGQFLVSPKHYIEHTHFAKKVGYQLNTHCIGDSANRFVLKHVDTFLSDLTDHRWRIEHAQVVHPSDIHLFSSSDVIPSIQPTHAVSDFRFAPQKLGKERLLGAYAYRSLLDERQMVLIGTDFPVEEMDPFASIHAATHRKNTEGEPVGGFLPNESLTFEETLKGMTLWAAYGAFNEKKTGSLEKGKEATFVILDHPLLNSPQFEPNYAFKTYVRGEEVYSLD